jgi:hypothetical protein
VIKGFGSITMAKIVTTLSNGWKRRASLNMFCGVSFLVVLRRLIGDWVLPLARLSSTVLSLRKVIRYLSWTILS